MTLNGVMTAVPCYLCGDGTVCIVPVTGTAVVTSSSVFISIKRASDHQSIMPIQLQDDTHAHSQRHLAQVVIITFTLHMQRSFVISGGSPDDFPCVGLRVCVWREREGWLRSVILLHDGTVSTLPDQCQLLTFLPVRRTISYHTQGLLSLIHI